MSIRATLVGARVTGHHCMIYIRYHCCLMVHPELLEPVKGV